MSIDLSTTNEQFLDAIVAAGVFSSRSDAMNEAVEVPRRREELRAEIKIGIEQLDRGEGEPLDMREIRDEIQRRFSTTEFLSVGD